MKTNEEKRLLKFLDDNKIKLRMTHTTYDGKHQTIAYIKIGKDYFQGVATCSKTDRFDKKIGRVMAIGRAVKHLLASDVTPYVIEENKVPEFFRIR